MLNYNKKYKVLISSIVLSGYLFLSLITVFHFHRIELLNPFSITDWETHNTKINLINSGLNCFVIQNFNSLHTTITNDLFSDEVVLTDIDYINCLISSEKLSSYLFPSFYLRAPPIDFS